MINSLLRRIVSRITLYDIFVADASDVPAPDTSDRAFTAHRVTDEWLPAIEAARPGYAKMAKKYLADGHMGIALVAGEEIAALGWQYHNARTAAVRVEYYPLAPGRNWFHADWTSPHWRGKGLHKRMIQERAALVRDSCSAGYQVVESNIEQANAISVRNYEHLGFVKHGKLLILRLPTGKTLARRLGK